MRKFFVIVLIVIAMVATGATADSTPHPAMTVAVTAFDVQGDAGRDWIGKAMQQGLATGLQHNAALSGVIVSGLPPADASSAISTAKSAGADAVIFGSVQVVGDQIRVTGQIISTSTGQTIGTLRSDGAKQDLFNIEDILADRAQRLLSPPKPQVAAARQPAATFTIVGPGIPAGPSKYFDGNIIAQITPPAQFRDQYDRYYYQGADTYCLSWCSGAPWGAWGCGVAAPFCGGACPVIATPVTGW